MKAVRFFLAPLLLLSLIATSLYLGLARPGAGRALASEVMTSEVVRQDLASALLDQLESSDNTLLTALISTDRPKAEAAVAQSLNDPLEQQQIGDAVETLVSAMFSGKSSVEIDSTPIYRPIYQGLDAVFPALKLSNSLDDLDPIVVGAENPLPDLRVIRTLLLFGLLLWPIWLLLVALYIRRHRRAGWRLVAIHTLVIAGVSTVMTFAAPIALQALVSDPIQKVLVATLTGQLTFAALWLSLVLVIAATVTLLLTRERTMTGQSAA